MKKTFKYLALMLVGLSVVSCSDDDLLSGGSSIQVGDEILIGATAKVEKGDLGGALKDSRTAYGDPKGNKIPIYWAYGDKLDVACVRTNNPNDKNQSLLATYQIPYDETNMGQSIGVNTQSILNRVSPDPGLQWGEGFTAKWPDGISRPGTHIFYGLYPSATSFNAEEDPSAHVGMKANGLVGYLPVDQTNTEAVAEWNADTKKYSVSPDMRYAFMVTKTFMNRDEAAKKGGVNMDFSPLVTTLKFNLTPEFIRANQSIPKDANVTIKSVQLSSASEDICGAFVYNYKNGKTTVQNDRPGEHKGITLSMPGTGVKLEKGQSCDVTFFVLPTLKYTAQTNDLSLLIKYEVDGVLTGKTAKLHVDIEPRKMYYFEGMNIPVQLNPEGSLWFSFLNPAIYLSEVSLPCAGNTFSNLANGQSHWYAKEQTLSYTEMWKQGIRGFELTTDYTDVNGNDNQSLRDLHFVCGEQVLTESATFHQAFCNLAKYLVDDSYKNFNKECLVVIARYHAVNGVYSPQNYVNNLVAYLNSLAAGVPYIDKQTGETKTIKIPAEKFVSLSNSQHVGDLQGKIAIIVRPGDDDYMKWSHEDAIRRHNSSEHLDLTGLDLKDNSSEITLGNWSQKICVIHNWGGAWDNFDKRYTINGKKCARNSTWSDGLSTSKPVAEYPRMEPCLGGISTQTNNYNPVDGYGYSTDEPVSSLTYDHTTSAGLTAYIQEWARVSPIETAINNGFYAEGNFVEGGGHIIDGKYWGRFLWVKWPESISQKKTAIDQVFRLVKGRKPGLHINVLSGYYITKKHVNSCEPFKQNWSTDKGKITPSGQGNGGNYAALARDLNTYVYDQLKKDAYGEGPLGLVMMDYIGGNYAATLNSDEYGKVEQKDIDAAKALPQLILDNNTKFALHIDPNYVPSTAKESVTFDFQYTDQPVNAD